jgi:hypothetical protein
LIVAAAASMIRSMAATSFSGPLRRLGGSLVVGPQLALRDVGR